MQFKGSIVALVTPFDQNERVDEAALGRLIDWHVGQGSDGLVIAGTTGESATLTSEEHADLVRLAVELAAGRLPIIAGTGSNSTAQTVALSAACDEVGIAGLLLVTPYYNKPSQQGLCRHFEAVAEAVQSPILLYNVPGRTCCDLLPETLARLAEHPRIVGLKDATGDLDRHADYRAAVDEHFALLSGDDATSLEYLLAGGHGTVTVTGNVAPAAVAEMCDLATRGAVHAARSLDARLQALHSALFVESNPIPVKWALCRMGLIGPALRLPLTELDPSYVAQLEAALRLNELID